MVQRGLIALHGVIISLPCIPKPILFAVHARLLLFTEQGVFFQSCL